MRILLVDDDPDTHEFITTYLTAAGFDVQGAYNGLEGIHQLHEYRPDLLILDVELPHLDGWDVCRRVRTVSDLPILMISAVARDEHHIIRALNAGADDYLLKPIHLEILKAHINALLRRSMTFGQHHSFSGYLDSHLTIDLRQAKIFVKGERVSLSFLEYRLLELLVANADATVPNLEIIEQLWSERADDSYLRYVRIYIKRLREAIEPDPNHPVYIVTAYAHGYRFCSQQ